MRSALTCVAMLLAAGAALTGQVLPDAPDRRVEQLLAGVSEARLRTIVETLAGFGTRHTLSRTHSATRGIGAARLWISDELRRSSPRLQVSLEIHHLAAQGRITRDADVVNVVALLPGRSARRVYVTAHYDTVSTGPDGTHAVNTRPPDEPPPDDPQLDPNQDYDVDAPGANDNASGTALTMELARVLANSGLEFEASLAFVLWAGEEQGLFGSRVHAAEAAAAGVPVEAVLNNDVVGNSRGGDGTADAWTVRVYSGGPEDSTSRALARHVARAAARYVRSHRVRLMARADRFSRASDHLSFEQQGYPAIVVRESRENFRRQHSPADTADGVDFRYLAQNARVNLAAAATLALAPPAPVVVTEKGQPTIGRQPSGYDANLRWARSPGAVAYRIYWRDAWASDWQHERLVGDVAEVALPRISIDDHVFGVSAVGPGGHESLVSAYVAPPRRDENVKLLP